jgi:hypothetical protein
LTIFVANAARPRFEAFYKLLTLSSRNIYEQGFLFTLVFTTGGVPSFSPEPSDKTPVATPGWSTAICGNGATDSVLPGWRGYR